VLVDHARDGLGVVAVDVGLTHGLLNQRPGRVLRAAGLSALDAVVTGGVDQDHLVVAWRVVLAERPAQIPPVDGQTPCSLGAGLIIGPQRQTTFGNTVHSHHSLQLTGRALGTSSV
jgi:hypothetical protein